MEKLLFPRGVLDTQDIPALASLSSAQKYLWSMCCLNANAAGVVYMSATLLSGLGLVQSVTRQLACELAARGLVAFDEETNELFVLHWFHWQKPPCGEDKWSRQVAASRRKVNSIQVQDAIQHALDAVPVDRIPAVIVPTNLISSLRHPMPGKRWEATPALLLLAIYTWPTMGWGGVCVADYEAWATYISAGGAEQIIGHLKDLDRAGNIVFDFETGEVFLPVRLKNANPDWHMQEILTTRSECISLRVKTNFSRLFTRIFGKFPNKSDPCALVDFSLSKKSSSKAQPPAAPATASFQEGWLKTETHPLTAAALETLFQSAMRRNKRGSDEGLDTARCRRGLELAERTLPDSIAAEAIEELMADGWPKEIEAHLKTALADLNRDQLAANQKQSDRRYNELVKAAGGDGAMNLLVGKTLINSAGERFLVEKSGVRIKTHLALLPKVLKMVNAGDLKICESSDQGLAA